MTIQGAPDVGAGLRLHLNENTAGCSPRVVEAIGRLDAGRIATYPDYGPVVLATAAYLGVRPERLVLTNGLDEGILLTCIATLGRPGPIVPEVIVVVPGFDAYASMASAFAARIVTVASGADYTFPLDDVLGAITERTRLVFLNTPNNPTGQVIPKEAIRAVLGAVPREAVVLLDEAYHDFAGEHFLGEAERWPRLLVGRTFSKAHGLAGMRIGCVVGAPALLEPIRAILPLFNLNTVAVTALGAALADPMFMPAYLAQVRDSKALLYAALDRRGIRYWPSAANFVLVEIGPRAEAIVEALAGRGVHVRNRSRDPHSPGCIRITTGVVAHTRDAIRALEDVL